MTVKRITPLLLVDAIEPSLPFYTEMLGFEATISVPEGDVLGFVMLVRDELEIMLQTRASVQADIPALLEGADNSVQYLYIEVADLAVFERALEGIELAAPKRTTFYGATEIVVRDPSGHFLVIAEMAPPE